MKKQKNKSNVGLEEGVISVIRQPIIYLYVGIVGGDLVCL